jgi:hypothetical protein
VFSHVHDINTLFVLFCYLYDIDHPPLSGAEVKERVELYLYSPFRPSWLVLRRTVNYELLVRY